MLLHGTDALKEAAAAGHALPRFVAYSLETIIGRLSPRDEGTNA